MTVRQSAVAMSITALIAVDVQADFLPGGSLAAPSGDLVVAPLQALAQRFPLVVATRDFHPAHHASFEAQGGPWPPHCVIGTPGARLHPAVDALAWLVISKGTDPAVDAYSGFDGTRLAEMLRAVGVHRLVIGGLATDYCVRATALAAQKEGFETASLTRSTRSTSAPVTASRRWRRCALRGSACRLLLRRQRRTPDD
jgi:nicotinamidase/pyrazinamidase